MLKVLDPNLPPTHLKLYCVDCWIKEQKENEAGTIYKGDALCYECFEDRVETNRYEEKLENDRNDSRLSSQNNS